MNVRINSYATYSSNGITVYITLYVPAYESPQPQFMEMVGSVQTTFNKKTTYKSFVEFTNGATTISTSVDTGVKGSSGSKGQIYVTGMATALNALAGGGGFSITYPITIP